MRFGELVGLSLMHSLCARVWDFEVDVGGVADKDDLNTAWKNGQLINATFAKLAPGDTFRFPNKTFHTMGGIAGRNFYNVTISFDGTLVYSDDIKAWPRNGNGMKGGVKECMELDNITNVTITSSGKGLIDGKGKTWWGFPFIGYLERQENRPRLLTIGNSKNLLIENIILLNSPYWTFWVYSVDGLEVRNVDISARRTKEDSHSLLDISAFNTDGFDVTGNNVWIHDCTVWNQDDTIAVKDGSTNMVFERINASGVGLTIGSIGGSFNKNITFRDIHMHHTYKGIYMKFRDGKDGHIEDVLYENIVIDEPEQWPIWIGPAQQSDSDNLCAAHPCSICWPMVPFASCTPSASTYINITLRNITVNNPKYKYGSGLILANSSNGMQNVIFDNVVVNNPPKSPLHGHQYVCDGVANGIATGKTSPVPPCFKDMTDTNTAPKPAALFV